MRSERESAQEVIAPIESADPPAKGRPSPVFYTLFAICVVLIAAIAAYLSVHGLPRTARDAVTQPASLNDLLWDQLFRKDRDTFIVPADSGLVIMQGLTRRPVSLSEYASGGYRAETASSTALFPADVKELGARRYTSIVDLSLVSLLARLKQIVPERMMIRYARDFRIDDLRSGNAILLGSIDSEPWVELFEQQMNFRFVYCPKTAPPPSSSTSIH